MVSIFDWELATIGDPLADLGYLTVTWVARGRSGGHDVQLAVGGDPRGGLPQPRGADRPLRGAQRAFDGPPWPGTRRWRSGRRRCSWRATTSAFCRGPATTAFPRGCSTRACPPWPRRPARSHSRRMKGLLVDFGGVLTTNVFDSFRDFCVKEGLGRGRFPDPLARPTRGTGSSCAGWRRARSRRPSSRGRLAGLLGVAEHEGLVDRLFAGMRPDEPMLEAVRRGQGSRCAHRAGLQLAGRGPLRPLRIPPSCSTRW